MEKQESRFISPPGDNCTPHEEEKGPGATDLRAVLDEEINNSKRVFNLFEW
jgi:hypothetical protein